MVRLATDERRLVLTRAHCDQQASELSEEWTATEQVRNKVDRLAAASDAATLKRDSIASEQQRRQELIGDLNSALPRRGRANRSGVRRRSPGSR